MPTDNEQAIILQPDEVRHLLDAIGSLDLGTLDEPTAMRAFGTLAVRVVLARAKIRAVLENAKKVTP